MNERALFDCLFDDLPVFQIRYLGLQKFPMTVRTETNILYTAHGTPQALDFYPAPPSQVLFPQHTESCTPFISSIPSPALFTLKVSFNHNFWVRVLLASRQGQVSPSQFSVGPNCSFTALITVVILLILDKQPATAPQGQNTVANVPHF